MEKFQLMRLKPIAYNLILASLAAVTIPTGQSLLIPETVLTIIPSQTIPTPESVPVLLDGMLLDTIQTQPAIPVIPPCLTKALA
ncbi:hypothetical protein Y085_10475 [Salmonella enterica subsp. enterica serovar Infantis str. CVM N35495PS]|nr:hypothetical protein AW50_49920 [Salmonella enterica subsp. enterica serovar Anatum str. USDA-ARS-USMARC-1735]PHI67173.1 hypothetical protein Y085_10475 [Salmonella enterica subsp. enterica serovar Infantis str. CVM N35495PS]